MDLVPIVANDLHHVHVTFYGPGSQTNRLREYLKDVREVGVALLGQGRGAAELFEGSAASGRRPLG